VDFPKGLFWTKAIPSHSFDFDFEDAEAELELENFELDDYHDVANALINDKEVNTGHVNVELNWSGVLKRGTARVNDPATKRKFTTQWINDKANLEWSAAEPATQTAHGFKFHSTGGSTGFGQIARERNGKFFK
jgi:hypothetical protein